MKEIYWRVVISKQAQKSLRKIPASRMRRVIQWIESIQSGISPLSGDTKKLTGQTSIYRTRIGIYRILFEIIREEIVVYVIDIKKRSDTTYRQK